MSCMYAINAPPRPKPNYFTYCIISILTNCMKINKYTTLGSCIVNKLAIGQIYHIFRCDKYMYTQRFRMGKFFFFFIHTCSSPFYNLLVQKWPGPSNPLKSQKLDYKRYQTYEKSKIERKKPHKTQKQFSCRYSSTISSITDVLSIIFINSLYTCILTCY